VIPLPSADADTDSATDDAAETEQAAVDEGRQSLLEAITDELGDALVASHLEPGTDLWLRVDTDAWASTADYLRNRQRFRFFDWLSAIDWMQSPYGRSLDAEVDKELGAAAGEDGSDVAADDSGPTGTGADGVTGGATRFQVMARVYSLTTHLGLTIKADVGDDLTVGTWTKEYPGADWHEREVWEMYGINFDGHPGLRNLYLPGDFEGHPLRKDYPLLARIVKPWPGIVDVEPMPEPDSEPESSATGADAEEGSS
jgi:NADH-quinone oxidoreductase subunit C